jgi:hypothetical protein
MKLQAQHKTTPFNRKYKTNNNESIDIPDTEAEGVDITEEEYIRDLRTHYTDEQIGKIMKIHDIYPTLDNVNRLLFDAYFIEDLSYDKIREKYTFFRTKGGKKVYYKSKKSIYNLMLGLKSEIWKKL